MRACCIRAVWVLSEDCQVCFSRRYPTVEREWGLLCKQAFAEGAAEEQQQQQQQGEEDEDGDFRRGQEASSTGGGRTAQQRVADYCFSLPLDPVIASAFHDHTQRQQSSPAAVLRGASSVPGDAAWLDDPIACHVIALSVPHKGGENKDESAPPPILWPLLLHRKGPFWILVLPLVHPRHLAAYDVLRWQPDCGGSGRGHGSEPGGHRSLSSLLLDLPAVTGGFAVAHAAGNLIGEDSALEAQAGGSVGAGVATAGSSMAALLGMPTPGRPSKLPAAAMAASASFNAPSVPRPRGRAALRASERELLRIFLTTSMPHGCPVDLNPITLEMARCQMFGGAAEGAAGEQKQPAWKPLPLPGGVRQQKRLQLTLCETISAALYDRDDVADIVLVSGKLKCRAELEGLPDVTVTLATPPKACLQSLVVHLCCQAPDTVSAATSLIFSPPPGTFELAHYGARLAAPALGGSTAASQPPPPPVTGFYQIQMVSENEGALLIKLKLMEGYRAPAVMEACSLVVPFARRKVVGLEGVPSLGQVATLENALEWRIVLPGKGLQAGRLGGGGGVEASLSGTLTFGPLQDVPATQGQADPGGSGSRWEYESEGEDEEHEEEGPGGRGARDSAAGPAQHLRESFPALPLAPAGWDDPFCWQAYDYAKASFRMTGVSMAGISIDPKKVQVYPSSAKAPTEVLYEVASGDYVLWNSLGSSYPHAVMPPT